MTLTNMLNKNLFRISFLSAVVQLWGIGCTDSNRYSLVRSVQYWAEPWSKPW